MRTAFNLLGPLTNPARPKRQLVGVPRPELTELVARSLLLLGAERAWVVHGADGIDEISTTGYTKVSECRDGRFGRSTCTRRTSACARCRSRRSRGAMRPERGDRAPDSARETRSPARGRRAERRRLAVRGRRGRVGARGHRGRRLPSIRAGAPSSAMISSVSWKHRSNRWSSRHERRPRRPARDDRRGDRRCPRGRAGGTRAALEEGLRKRSRGGTRGDARSSATRWRQCRSRQRDRRVQAAVAVARGAAARVRPGRHRVGKYEARRRGDLGADRTGRSSTGLSITWRGPRGRIRCRSSERTSSSIAYQVLEARAAGADAILLIVGGAETGRAVGLPHQARRLGRDWTCSSRCTTSESWRAPSQQGPIIGVNNRNLRTLTVDTDASRASRECCHREMVAVAESGVRTAADLIALRDAGYDAFLVWRAL